MNIIKTFTIIICIIGFLVISLFSYKYLHQLSSTKNDFKPLRIAHAGGAIKNKTYTNSYEALNSNLEKGFLYFELDFSFTKDDKLVCLHDWQHSFKRSFGYEVAEKVTLKEFKELVDTKSQFTKCTLDGLATWLSNHPSAHIVTDVKGSNISALKKIYETLPDADKRVIPQIYDPKNFDLVKDIGFEQIIWTLYRFRGTNDQVLGWIEKFHGPIAITMPKQKAESPLPNELKSRQIVTYVHTVNEMKEFKKFAGLGITEIYTDYLQPKTQ